MALANVGDLTVVQLAQGIAAGELDPFEVCERFLTHATDTPAEHAYITVTRERALREARAAERRRREGRPRSPLDGVPVAWKDVFDVAGSPTTAGSAIRRDAPPAYSDAGAVTNLERAGMACLGKTNLTELAFSGLGLNPHFGTPRNPHASAHVPGGSSSGSAVAVATGAAPCSIGTDTSGSVRVPAAFCGLVGFKATSTVIDRAGAFPLAPSLDSVGTLTRTVSDAIALLAALRGDLPRIDLNAPATTEIELVIPDGEAVTDVSDDVGSSFEEAISRLSRAGVKVRTAELHALHDVQRCFDRHGTLVAAEASRTHTDLLDTHAAALDPRVAHRLRGGTEIPDRSVQSLHTARSRLRRQILDETGHALVACPTVRHTAPRLAPLERDDAHFADTNSRTLRTTMLTSFLDMPGVSLPVGASPTGLPVGMLISAPAGTDARLLRACLTLESALHLPHGPATTA